MSNYSIKDIAHSTDRHKIYILTCNPDDLSDRIAFVKSENINAINIGKELASYIESLNDHTYLNIEVYEYIKTLLDKHKLKLNNTGNEVVAMFNLGILLEPKLELNAVQLLKEFSKTTALIIIWENQSDLPDKLNWLTQKQNYFLDFSDTPLKQVRYAI